MGRPPAAFFSGTSLQADLRGANFSRWRRSLAPEAGHLGKIWERPVEDHPRLVVQPFNGPTRLPGLEVIQDLLLPLLERPDEPFQLLREVQHVEEEPDQSPQGFPPVPGLVKDPLEAHPELVQRPQPRHLPEQRLQLLPLRPGQLLRVAAEFPQQAAKLLSLRLGQLRLVRPADFFSAGRRWPR